MSFKETRPSRPDRFTTFMVDNATGAVEINRNGEEMYQVIGENVKVLKGDKEVSRGITLRDYYLYLRGVPMKRCDESTPKIKLASDEVVNGVNCKVLRVAYEEDTWYFYMDAYTGRMLQYTFYKDEAAGKGELITLQDEIICNGIKIPQKRSWYTLPEMKYLETDILEKTE